MKILVFLLMTAYVPWMIQGALAPRWIIGLIGVSFLLYRIEKIHWTPAHTLVTYFVGWCIFTGFWSPFFYDFGTNAGILFLFWLAFLLGAGSQGEDIVEGLLWGLMVNLIFVILQKSGIKLWEENVSPSGLFLLRNPLGELALIGLIGALIYRRYYFLPPVMVLFALTWSRASLIMAGVAGGMWLWKRNKWAVGALVSVGLAAAPFVLHMNQFSSGQRAQVWMDILPHLSILGKGLGSFAQTYPTITSVPNFLERYNNVHNDYLELFFECGLPGLVLFCGVLLMGLCSERPERYILGALAVEAFFVFPLRIPTTVVIFGLVAGLTATWGYRRWWVVFGRRSHVHNWMDKRPARLSTVRSDDFSLDGNISAWPSPQRDC